MADRRNAARESAGFTLLELIVVLVVLGFLLTASSRACGLGFSAWNKQSAEVGTRDQLDATDRALRLMIDQFDPGTDGGDQKFIGKADNFFFRTQLPSAVALATRRIDATLLVDTRHRLVLRWVLAPHEERLGPRPALTETELLSGVDQMVLSYWHPADDNGGPAWVSEWASMAPPRLVKIHLAFPKGDRRRWPDIIAGPALDPQGG